MTPAFIAGFVKQGTALEECLLKAKTPAEKRRCAQMYRRSYIPVRSAIVFHSGGAMPPCSHPAPTPGCSSCGGTPAGGGAPAGGGGSSGGGSAGGGGGAGGGGA